MGAKSRNTGIGAELAGKFDLWSGRKSQPEPGPRLLIASGGIDSPYDMTLKALLELRSCDVVFADRLEVKEQNFLLEDLCKDVRPIPGTTGKGLSGKSAEKELWRQIQRELNKDLTVGFVTYGHPLLFSGGHNLALRCRRNGYRYKLLTSVSAADSIMTALNDELGSFILTRGFSIMHAEDLLASKWSSPLPTIVYGVRGMARNPGKLARFCKVINAAYGANDSTYVVSCRTRFSPGYIHDIPVKELGVRLAGLAHDPSLVLPGVDG
jgi:hypothetical protein